jgi:glycosyltransferase involved in cell wall biosynthesis
MVHNISVIVPVYNAEKTITLTLSSILKQKCSYPYEIIVVDDGSTDSTAKIVEKCIATANNPKTVRLIKSPHKGPAAARNTGVKKANGDIILFVDSDCVANEKWISSMVDTLSQDESVVAVGGTYRTLNTGSMTARFVGCDIAYRHNHMNKLVDHIGTFSAAFRKEALLKVGLFDEFFTQADSEDTDISYRLIALGYKLAIQPEGWVLHHHPSTAYQYIRRQCQRAYWRAALYTKHREKIKNPDMYTTWQTHLQPFIWGAFVPLTLLSLVVNPILVLYLSVASIVAVTLLNADFISWAHSQEKSGKFLVFSFGLCILRSLAWTVGGVLGLLKFARGLKRVR